MTEIKRIDPYELNCLYCGPYIGWINTKKTENGLLLVESKLCPKCCGQPHFKSNKDGNWTPQEKSDFHIPKRFESATLENYIAKSAAQKKVKSIASQYVKNFSKYLEKGTGGLIFTGDVGTGKTHLSIGILKAVNTQNHKHKCRYVNVFDMVADIKATWKDNYSSEAEVIKKYCSYELIVVDEIGVQYGSTAENVILFRILNQRYLEQKPTILVSNLDEEGLVELLGPALVDRIHEGGGGVVSFDWGSKRRKTS